MDDGKPNWQEVINKVQQSRLQKLEIEQVIDHDDHRFKVSGYLSRNQYPHTARGLVGTKMSEFVAESLPRFCPICKDELSYRFSCDGPNGMIYGVRAESTHRQKPTLYRLFDKNRGTTRTVFSFLAGVSLVQLVLAIVLRPTSIAIVWLVVLLVCMAIWLSAVLWHPYRQKPEVDDD